MVARTDGDAEAVQNGRCVMGMDAVDGEGNDAGFFSRVGTADDVDMRDFLHPFQAVAGQFFFMGFDVVHAQVLQIVDGSVQSNGTFDVLGTGFEFEGQFVKGRRLFLDIFDHVAAEEERFHAFQDGFLAVKDARAGRTAHLVAREGEEVAVHILDVGLHVRCRLSTVDDGDGSDGMGFGDDFLDRALHAEDVADSGKGDDFRLVVYFSQVSSVKWPSSSRYI